MSVCKEGAWPPSFLCAAGDYAVEEPSRRAAGGVRAFCEPRVGGSLWVVGRVVD